MELQKDSKTALIERIDRQAEKLDFSKTNLTEQKGYREFATMTFAAFELSQEITADGQKRNSPKSMEKKATMRCMMPSATSAR